MSLEFVPGWKSSPLLFNPFWTLQIKSRGTISPPKIPFPGTLRWFSFSAAPTETADASAYRSSIAQRF